MGRRQNRQAAQAAVAAVTLASATQENVTEQVITDTLELPASTDKGAPKSIRSLVMSSLLAGRPRAAIAADIQRYFPTSRAAVLSSKHISWYAGRMKKDGVILPVPAKVQVTPIATSEAAAAESTEA